MGGVITEEATVAARLCAHLAAAFEHRPVDEARLALWQEAATKAGASQVDAPPAAWRLQAKDVAKVVRISGDARPGPEGVPFAAWRALGPMTVQRVLAVLYAPKNGAGGHGRDADLRAGGYTPTLHHQHKQPADRGGLQGALGASGGPARRGGAKRLHRWP